MGKGRPNPPSASRRAFAAAYGEEELAVQMAERMNRCARRRLLSVSSTGARVCVCVWHGAFRVSSPLSSSKALACGASWLSQTSCRARLPCDDSLSRTPHLPCSAVSCPGTASSRSTSTSTSSTPPSCRASGSRVRDATIDVLVSYRPSAFFHTPRR